MVGSLLASCSLVSIELCAWYLVPFWVLSEQQWSTSTPEEEDVKPWHYQRRSWRLECRGALGFRGFGLHSDTAPNHQSRRGQSHIPAQPRAKRSHNDAGKCPAGAKNIDPAFRHHRLVILAWATGDWEGTPDLDTMQAALRGSLARLSHLKRPWCGATDAAATFVLILLRLGWSAQSARHLTTHDDTKIDFLAVAPKTVGYWVDQASLLWSDSSAHWNQSKGPLFWEAIRPLLVSGKLEGWSLWHRNVLVKLVSRGIWTQERLARLRGKDDGSCELCNDGPGTMFHRCYECPALQTERDMYVSQEVRAAARAVGSSSHTAFFRTLAPCFQQVLLNASARSSGTIAPRWVFGGAHFHGRLFVGLRCAATCWLGCGGGRRCGKPQGGSVWSGTERHFARAVRSRWRRICSGHGEAHHLGSAHAAHRLRRYHRDNQRSKAQSCFPTTRSGLFRAVPKQTLSWLDWSTFVGLLRRGNYTGGAVGSCEAGLGRTVMGPTTPNKQRVAPHAAVLAHWERVGEFADSENLAMQRFDQRRSKLWEAYGLNDQLESRPVVFALTRQTGLALQVGFYGLFSTAQARLRRYVCSGLRWVFQLRKRGRAI